MTELEEIRKRKLAEFQAHQAQEVSEQEKVASEISQLESLVKQVMTKEARERYSTVKLVHPNIAVNALVALTQAMQAGQIRQINDETLKTVLKAVSEKRSTSITRK